ncbi:MAG TPA: DNA-protecting protein DprA [Clostridiales bacterium]|nr:DNA-protecting protein DprA [Clostridiales bacterium]
MRQIEYQYWLANIQGIGIKKRQKLLNEFHNAENVFKASKYKLLKTFLNKKDIDNIINSKNIDNIKRELEELDKKGIDFITIENNTYPAKLREIYDPPYALYVKGKLPSENEKVIAVVGARDCSDYGIEVATYLTNKLAKNGISIVSGLARGIDYYSHKGALSSNGITYAVLGSGVDICYPIENFNIYMDMQKQGGVISEYKHGSKPLPHNFPMRNRMISGLSDGILVVEARQKSGSLITVDMGLDQGKEIYSVPGRITDKLSYGCNNLLGMGAKIVTTPDDILEDLLDNYKEFDNNSKINIKILENEEKVVYACLGFTPKHIDEVQTETNMNITQLITTLLSLEMKDYIYQSSKNYYSKRLNIDIN